MIRAGIVGAAFAGELHAQGLAATGRVEIAAVVSASAASREAFAARWGCRAHPTVESMLAAERLDVVTLAMPNRFHRDATLLAAAAGAHVVCEKPLAMNLSEADEMITACRDAGVTLFYGEQLCFAPRYVAVRDLVRSRALGDIISVSHRERHGGPHARWFHDPALSGGGALLDMGCHGIAVIRWLLDRRPVTGVSARLGIHRHRDGVVEDHAVVSLGLEGGTVGLVDASWAAPGGIDERLEVLGTKGSVVADLARGQALLVYTDTGVGYGVEKAASTTGWTFVAHEEARTWGWFGEMSHVVDCIEGRATPEVTGDDGRAVLEVVMAAYEAAARRAEVSIPFAAPAVRPIDPWLEFGQSS